MSGKSYHNAQLRKEHLPTIRDFLDEAGLRWNFVHGFEWHIRVEGQIDIFPTRNRYHVLSSDVRGSFEDYDQLGQIFTENLK